MTLIPKAGTSGTAVKDKRPISLLNVDGKLLDKILNNRLYTFLEENDLQNERQVISPVGLCVKVELRCCLFACFFVVLFIYILVGILVNSLSEKLKEIWNVFEGLFHLASVCHIIRGFCTVVESIHVLHVCVDKC